MRGTPLRRGILALDIEGFGQPSRTDPDRAHLRSRLHALLDHALATAQIPPEKVAQSDLGDGILMLFDPTVSAAVVLHPLLSDLTSWLLSDNQTEAGPARLRLRVAVHEGQVLADQHGYTGEDLNHVFRLLDAQATRTLLADNFSADAVLVVSDGVFQGIVRHGYDGLDPSVWQPIRVHAKETRTRAWVHLPSLARQPNLPAVLAAPSVGPTTLPIPRELPAPTKVFTGRTSELQQLGRLLDSTTKAVGRPMVISAIDGMGGIGKSVLAIQAAQGIVEQFPDGQLYINLHGATPGHPPLTPLDALGRILRSLGVDPAAIPTEVEEATARWRSLAAERRLLVVLDNARTAEQVRPLLPASRTCAVLVTSRQVLATLDGAQPLHLDLLPPEQARELLGRIAGPERVAAEPEAADEVVRLCGLLPLAIRIAGARLNARPNWPVSELAGRLADATGRLDELTAQGLGMRAAFDVSVEALQHSPDPIDQAAAGMFGLLSLPDGPDLDATSAARLLDQSEPTTKTLLERLVDAQLLESLRPGRYQFHDLVRLYARQHAKDQCPQAEWHAALTRLFGFYTATAWRTLAVLYPGDHRLTTADPTWTSGGLQFPDTAEALGWLEAERGNLLAAVGQTGMTAPATPPRLAIELTRALFGFFYAHDYWTDWVQADQTALELARRIGDRARQAHILSDLGVVNWRLGRYQEAIVHQQQSLTIRREVGDRWGQAASLSSLGLVYWRLCRYQEAIDHHHQALTLAQEIGYRRGHAASLGNLGLVYWRLGRHQEAIDHHHQALTLFQELGDRFGQASKLCDLGLVYLRLGRYQEAIDHQQQSLTIRRGLGDRWGQADSLENLGLVYLRLGRYQEAIDHQQQSLIIFREIGDRWGQAISLNNLGEIYERLGHHRAAINHQQQSLVLAREIGDPYGHAVALQGLGNALLGVGRHRQAHEAWQKALEFFETLQVPEADAARSRLAALPDEPKDE